LLEFAWRQLMSRRVAQFTSRGGEKSRIKKGLYGWTGVFHAPRVA